jgi:hypothetical protein
MRDRIRLPDVCGRFDQTLGWRELFRPDPFVTDARSQRLAFFREPCSPSAKEKNMRLSRLSLAVAVLTVAWLLSVPAANAQAQSPSSGGSAQSQDIPEERLDAAAAALERVVSLTQDYQGQMLAAPPSKQDRIAEEAKKALVKAVTDQGLSVTEYALILEAAQKDPEFRGKLLQRMDPAAR